MKQIRIILVLMLTLAIVLGTFTSCEYLGELELEDLFPDTEDLFGESEKTPDNDDKDETPDEKVDPETCGHFVTTISGKRDATCTEKGYTGDKVCYACGTVITAGAETELAEHKYVDGKCSVCGEEEEGVKIPESWASYETITIAEALTLCEQFVESPSTDRYYIIATVKSVDSATYGQLTITDETGEIMVYGTQSSDGSLKYDKMGIELKAGDTILIYGTLQNYKGNTKEVQSAWLIDHVAGTVVPPSVDVEPGSTITIEKALEIAGSVGENDRFYITGTVVSVTKPQYGAMVISDGTNEISIYGSYSADGSIGYANMADKPYKGDTVTVYATLQVFNGTPEIKSAWITEFKHAELSIDPDDYTLSTIAEARDVADGEVVKVQGVVARITFANGYVPSGFILIDGTASIYVYDGDAAGRVAIGNTVTLVGAKDHWILEGEKNNAEKYGYKGCNQITSVVLVDNDNGNSDFDKSWIEESTVKEIMDTPVSEDITTNVYKVTALVKKAVGTGFINYYIDDLDGVTGSYVYTQCSGGDFEWLDEFDGKICTVYLTALNAKSTASGCNWRFLPVAVVYENFEFDTTEAPKYAIDYAAKDQFLNSYTADPELELITSVSSELLGFEGVVLSYASSDEAVVKFVNENGKTVMHCVAYGTATVTITATYNGTTATDTVTVSYTRPATFEYITVEEAIEAEEDSLIVVKGIVGPSLINKVGFYLMGENGLIAVITDEDTMATLSIGNEIILEGNRETYINPEKSGRFGQSSIVNGKVLVNNLGNHEYNDDYFITGKTVADFNALDINEDHTTEVYVLEVVASFVETPFYTTLNVKDADGTELKLYMSGAGQYSWMQDYYGQSITVEVAPCNWNDKKDVYRGCILSIILEDGTKVYNTSNFDN